MLVRLFRNWNLLTGTHHSIDGSKTQQRCSDWDSYWFKHHRSTSVRWDASMIHPLSISPQDNGLTMDIIAPATVLGVLLALFFMRRTYRFERWEGTCLVLFYLISWSFCNSIGELNQNQDLCPTFHWESHGRLPIGRNAGNAS